MSTTYQTLAEARDALRNAINIGEAALARATKRAERVRLETRLGELEGKLAGIKLAQSYAPGRPTVEEEVEAAVGGIVVDHPSHPVAIWNQAAAFNYKGEQRRVSLYEVSANGESVLGYDHDREGLRRFRLDRIEPFADGSYVLPSLSKFREPQDG
jgi:hypothetical protein